MSDLRLMIVSSLCSSLSLTGAAFVLVFILILLIFFTLSLNVGARPEKTAPKIVTV